MQNHIVLHNKKVSIFKRYYKHRYLFLLLIPSLVFLLIFRYAPMYGVLIAFKKYRVLEGIMGSPWVGFDNFTRMFTPSNGFTRVLKNTVEISFLRLIFGFPVPIILALLINEVKNGPFKRVTQTISYLPHFLSWVILAGLFNIFLSPSVGLINQAIQLMGLEPIYFMADKDWFRPILIITGVWQDMGWTSIIYLAAITSIDLQLYEAAIIDGAGKMKQAFYVTIPDIMYVIVIMLIMSIGKIMNAGFDQIFNMYNPAVYDVSDIIDTYVYRVGLVDMDYSFSTAVGLFKNVIGLILVIASNRFAKHFGSQGIW